MSLYATVVESKQFLHSIGTCGEKKKSWVMLEFCIKEGSENSQLKCQSNLKIIVCFAGVAKC